MKTNIRIKKPPHFRLVGGAAVLYSALYYFQMKMRQDAQWIFAFWLTRMKRSVAALR